MNREKLSNLLYVLGFFFWDMILKGVIVHKMDKNMRSYLGS